ncbi:hypothetical protein VTK73DRAFT_9636 [Phialemonium thermophilum]|uniref:Uncharacterized protein n=1 Tax=Phialemonium thermophilum TaxID=223376 RepID=A0ABR3W1B5_9PEZI
MPTCPKTPGIHDTVSPSCTLAFLAVNFHPSAPCRLHGAAGFSSYCSQQREDQGAVQEDSLCVGCRGRRAQQLRHGAQDPVRALLAELTLKVRSSSRPSCLPSAPVQHCHHHREHSTDGSDRLTQIS